MDAGLCLGVSECSNFSVYLHVSYLHYAHSGTALVYTYIHITVEPPNKGHDGTSHFVLYREDVLSLEVKNALAR